MNSLEDHKGSRIYKFTSLLYTYGYSIMGFKKQKDKLVGWTVRKNMVDDIIFFPDENMTPEEFEDYLIMREL